MEQAIQINKKDNVAVALQQLPKDSVITIGENPVTLGQEIPRGHKFALEDIAKEDAVVKYGYPIGHATADIKAGDWVHTHNLKTSLKEGAEYSYVPALQQLPESAALTFNGFLRKDGKAGVRNEIWILPTVGCVNDVAEKLARDSAGLVGGSLEGVHAFTHPYGCSQMGDDHATTRKILADLAQHPNAGAVLVVGLGCENNTMEGFKQELGSWDEERIRFMVCQEEEDEIAAGNALLQKLAEYAKSFERQPLPVSKLIVGMKCGGSDGMSGITANPVVGSFSDLLIAGGGNTVLTEVPEMFGAEMVLMSRAVTPQVYEKAVEMVQGFKDYFTNHGQVVYENPSPGNKEGGISTLEDKSLGCVQKGGTAPVVDVIPYGGKVEKQGLTLLAGPGNDLVSATALAAAGAQIVLFTTGRGTPFSAPVPTLKISSNTPLFEKKKNWIDFNAGTVAQGEPMEEAGQRLLDYVLQVADGRITTKAEDMGYRGIAIFKDGVTL